MKPICFSCLLSLLVVTPIHADPTNSTDAPDGFYVSADAAPSYALSVCSNDGGLAKVQIREDQSFSPTNFVVSATGWIPNGYFMKVNGQDITGKTPAPGIVIVANHHAYFGYARCAGSSKTVSLLLNNREQTEAVSSALQKKFPSALFSIDLNPTNPIPRDISVEEMSPSKNWQWDQATADALLAKGNHDQSIAEALAYSRIMMDARVNGMPESSSEFPLPNYETGPGRPLPIHVNFYSINDLYSNYLLCEYEVDEKNYDQADESGWFKASLKQIRRSGSKKFPPIKWIAVIIVNRAEWNGAKTFEQANKAGAIFKAEDIFASSHDFSQLIAGAIIDRHPFKYDEIQPTPGDEQRWLIVEKHAAKNSR